VLAKRATAHDSAHSEALRLKLYLASSEHDKVAGAFWRHPRLAELIPDYLFLMHSIIRASVPLMEAALHRAALLSRNDSLALSLTKYFGQHVNEERHHDDWLLDDIGELGISPETVWARTPSPTVASLVGSQYYWIHHHHPVALLGYIAVLEGNPPEEGQIAEVIERTGLPERAFRTSIKHARLDPHHRDDLNAALDAMPLTGEQETLVAISALETQHLLAISLHDVVKDHSQAATRPPSRGGRLLHGKPTSRTSRAKRGSLRTGAH
jgi:Iron-containing redox enzyme